MAYCGKCGTQLSEETKFCPKCGRPCGNAILSTNSNSGKEIACTHSKKNRLYVIAILFIAIVTGCFWYFSKGNTSGYSLESLAKVVSNYEKVGDFHNGLASVVKEGKVGYINKYGEEIIPCKYDPHYGNSNFTEEFAVVYKDSYYGYIDKSGKEITKLIYASANEFKEGLALVEKAGKKGFIDNTGKEIIPLIYDYALDFSEGLAAVCQDGKWGFIDKAGKVIIPLSYSSAGVFSEGLASAYKDGKCGYIDKTGKMVIPFKYDGGEPFSEGYAQVSLDGNFYIDKTGKKISKEYHVTYPFKDGVAVVRYNAKSGIIDKTGKEILPCKYRIVESISEGIILVFDDAGNALYDTTGKKILDFEYDEGGYTNKFEEGYYIVKKDEKYGYIDKNGNEVIPCIYEEASPFSEGLAIVKIDGDIGVVDKKGNSTFYYNNVYLSDLAEKKESVQGNEEKVQEEDIRQEGEIKQEDNENSVNQQDYKNKIMPHVSAIQQIMEEINSIHNRCVSVSIQNPNQVMGVNAVADISELTIEGDRHFRQMISIAREAGKQEDINTIRQEMEDFDYKSNQMKQNILRLNDDMYQ